MLKRVLSENSRRKFEFLTKNYSYAMRVIYLFHCRFSRQKSPALPFHVMYILLSDIRLRCTCFAIYYGFFYRHFLSSRKYTFKKSKLQKIMIFKCYKTLLNCLKQIFKCFSFKFKQNMFKIDVLNWFFFIDFTKYNQKQKQTNSTSNMFLSTLVTQ